MEMAVYARKDKDCLGLTVKKMNQIVAVIK
jgi:hypothetical protein